MWFFQVNGTFVKHDPELIWKIRVGLGAGNICLWKGSDLLYLDIWYLICIDWNWVICDFKMILKPFGAFCGLIHVNACNIMWSNTVAVLRGYVHSYVIAESTENLFVCF